VLCCKISSNALSALVEQEGIF